MSERRCLESVRDRKPMSTNLFDLGRAEAAGFVERKRQAAMQSWSLTPKGEQRLTEYAATDGKPAE